VLNGTLTARLAERPAPPEPSWPSFALDAPPPHPLIVYTSDFLSRLSSSTNGEVVARLRWIPSNDDRKQIHYDAVAFPIARPASQTTLFAVSVDLETDALLVTDAMGVGHVLASASDVDAFLTELSEDAEIRVRIQSLLSLSRTFEPEA
jgi:hypothetical protein